MREPAERAQRRRQVILLGATLLLAGMQWIAVQTSYRVQEGPVRPVDVAQLLAPALVGLGILRGFFGAPLWLSPRVRRAANDELTADNRRRAMSAGLVGTVVGALGLVAVLPFERLESFEVAHLLLFSLLATTVGRFVWLEQSGGDDDHPDAA